MKTKTKKKTFESPILRKIQKVIEEHDKDIMKKHKKKT